MNVSELMTATVKSCAIDECLDRAARIMWENDCGCIPVVDHDQRVVGMITDRDICMAAYTQGKALAEMQVSSAMAREVFGARESDPVEVAEALMREKQVHRLPVLDGDGHVRGILSMNDLARRVVPGKGHKANGLSRDSVALTLAAISKPRGVEVAPARSRSIRSQSGV